MSEERRDWPDTPAARRNLETLSALARAIGMAAPGRFVLLLAKCNLPIQREALAEHLRAMLEPLGVELVRAGLGEPVNDLLSYLKAHLKQAGHHPELVSEPVPEPVEERHPESFEERPSARPQPAVVVAEPRASYIHPPPFTLSVHGLEASLRSDDPNPPLLAHLNLARERYRELGCPLVLWLPDYALTRLAREAPDFWAWRSGVFEFAPEPEVAESALRRMAYEPSLVTSSLDATAKRERLALLEQLLADYRELGKGPQEQNAQADILLKMGRLHHDLGEHEAALRAYREALEIRREQGEELEIAKLLHQLGELARGQANYTEARRLYAESLDIKQQLGDRAGVAQTLHQLGNLAYLQGNYAEARRLYHESLDIKQQLGDRAGVALTLGQLGVLTQAQGDYAEARRLYGESLDIAQQLGDRAGVAQTLGQLGTLAQVQGDYAEARRLHEGAAETFEQLGAQRERASVLHNLAVLAQMQGDYAEARRLYGESLDIEQQLGNRAVVATTMAQLALLEEAEGHLLRALELIRQAETIFTELGSSYAAQASRVRERLERQSA